MKQLLLAAALLGSAAAMAQDAGLEVRPKSKSYIVYAAEEHTITAGKNSVIELHFRVQDGFHVNSHVPKSELLMPTQLALEPAAGVKMDALEYQAGTAYRLDFEPSETLDVYSGPFTVKLPIVATVGEHHVSGTLSYQACDRAACYPPKKLPLELLFTAK